MGSWESWAALGSVVPSEESAEGARGELGITAPSPAALLESTAIKELFSLPSRVFFFVLTQLHLATN